MSVVATSTASMATAYSNQRKIDRTSNGVLWVLYWYGGAGTGLNLNYSTDDGTTWNNGGAVLNGSGSSTQSYIPNASLFIDQDDFAHVIFKDNSNGYIYYRRGTPNVERTAWTWSAPTTINAGTAADYPDVVAHLEGTGWAVHVVMSVTYSGNNETYYSRLDIDATGAVTLGLSATNITTVSGPGGIHSYPSIDFHHTGDGKTVKDGTPHLYVGWSAGTTGIYYGIRFRKAMYSGGSWTWGTERDVDTTRYLRDDTTHSLNCLFDGTRVVIGGTLSDGGTVHDLMLYERDAADTAAISRTLVSGMTTNTYFYLASMSYDAEGNLHFIGRNYDGANYSLDRIHWTRADATTTRVDVTPLLGYLPHPSVKRGHSNRFIEFIYTDGTASPYSVTYDNIVLNALPEITINTVTSADPRKDIEILWTYSDAENDPQEEFNIQYKDSEAADETINNITTGRTGSNQTFIVPKTSVYTITAKGARGGIAYMSGTSTVNPGGNGASLTGEFELDEGDELDIMVGQAGGDMPSAQRGGAGGGMTVVYNVTKDELLLCAGGGGGAGQYQFVFTNKNASLSTTGNSGGSSSTASGGAAGGVGPSGGSSISYGPGGGGFSTNGANASNTTGGASYENGGAGGTGYSVPSQGQNGGYGGGGGSYAGGGGGGGYGGGGGGAWSASGAGGGGGSYNAGTNQVNVVDNYDQGQVIIEAPWESVTIQSSDNFYTIPAGTLEDETTYDIKVRASDGYNYSEYDTAQIQTSSWIYGPIIENQELSYEETVLATGPVGYWRLNEETGSTAVDSSGNENDGIYYDNPKFGILGPLATGENAIDFSNPGSRFHVTGGVGDYTVNGGYSIEFWIKHSGTEGNHVGLYPYAAEDVNGWPGWLLHGSQDNSTIVFQPRLAGGAYGGGLTIVLTPEKWTHIVISQTSDGSTIGYRDGQDVTGIVNLPWPGGLAGFPRFGSSSTGNSLDVAMDEIVIYDKALSPEEITTHKEAAAKTHLEGEGIIQPQAITGRYEVQVKTADAQDFGDWSETSIVYVSDKGVYIDGEWKAIIPNFRHWQGWKEIS